MMINMKRKKIGERKQLILEAIPFDEWVSAQEIATKTGITPQAVGIIISKSLVPVFIERRETSERPEKTFDYKRRQIFLSPKRPRD